MTKLYTLPSFDFLLAKEVIVCAQELAAQEYQMKGDFKKIVEVVEKMDDYDMMISGRVLQEILVQASFFFFWQGQRSPGSLFFAAN